jgi:hypothetical protein
MTMNELVTRRVIWQVEHRSPPEHMASPTSRQINLLSVEVDVLKAEVARLAAAVPPAVSEFVWASLIPEVRRTVQA